MRIADHHAGLRLSTFLFEDKHVELAADVCDVVRAAGHANASFYGRDITDFSRVSAQIADDLRTQIPIIRHALGRPGRDPTNH